MKLLYDTGGSTETLSSWRLREEHGPDMPTKQEMLRMVAADPVSQAIFFDIMMKLFLLHVVGVDISDARWQYVDGVASATFIGIFGVVVAYFAPIETQGRGGLHAHMHLWILHPLTAPVLDRLRRGLLDKELAASLQRWRAAVIDKVASMQFDCVEEFGRQLNVMNLPRVPFFEDGTADVFRGGCCRGRRCWRCRSACGGAKATEAPRACNF